MIGTRAADPMRPSPPPWPVADDLINEVLPRRVVAWLLDGVLIAVLAGTLWISGFTFGLLTLGLGFPVLRLLPVVPLAYHWLSLMSPLSGTPGQRMMGLMVRRHEDLGPPTGSEALISVLAYYVTLALGVFWLGLALFTRQNRTPHDLLSGLVVVRSSALTGGAGDWTMRFGGRSNA